MSLLDLYLGSAYILGGLRIITDGVNKRKQIKYNAEAKMLNDVFYNQELKESNGDGLKGTIFKIKTIDDRIKKITDMVEKGIKDPRIRKIAVGIVSKKCGSKWCIKERDYQKEVEAVYKYIRDRVRYVKDIFGIDTYQNPIRTHEFGGGDCDDYSAYASALLLSIGYPVKLRVIQTKKAKDFNHIYILVAIPPKEVIVIDKETGRRYKKYIYVPFDASVDKYVGWEAPSNMIVKKKDYDLTRFLNV